MELYAEITFKEAMEMVGREEVSDLFIKYKAGESIIPFIFVKEDYYTLSQSQYFYKTSTKEETL